MKKARLQDGQVILAHQYNAAAHGVDLLCADLRCTAHMGFRREALTHGAQAIKDAHFFSHDKKEHIAGCTAHDDFGITAKQAESITKSLARGKNILINLNIDLSGEFSNAAAKTPHNLVCQGSTYNVWNYKTVGVKNIEAFLSVTDLVERKGGLERTYVNYKGKATPLKEFIIDSTEKYNRLMNKMWGLLQKRPDADSVTDAPHLISFRPTGASRAKKNEHIRGTPMVFPTATQQNMVLLQKADADKAFESTLRGESVYIIAEPTMMRNEAQDAMGFLAQKSPVAFLDMHWKVTSAAQFTPINRTPPAQQAEIKFNG